MEAGIAAGYVAETAVEGAVGAGIAIAKSTMPLKAGWKQIPVAEGPPRSSHSLSVIGNTAYVFGGEVRPREPVDNDMHVITLPSSGVTEADHKILPAAGPEVPPARVGHTANVIDRRIYVFGGRGGEDMTPLAEKGRVWVFDTISREWTFLDAVEGSPYPEPRSYHASAATAYPLRTSVDRLDSRFDPLPIDEQAHGTIFIHSGCPASGRLADLWGFDVASRIWSPYPDAPGDARGGASLAYAQDRLYRFGGYNGKEQMGGKIDHLDVSALRKRSGKGELPVGTHSGSWETTAAPSEISRSVAGLHPVTTGQGRNYLLLLLGEKNASASGHEGAGLFWDDVWSFQIEPESMSSASFKDATRRLIKAKTGEGSWAKVHIPESSMAEGQLSHPSPRGWFASAQGHDIGKESVVLWGGLTSSNERAGDGWILTVDF